MSLPVIRERHLRLIRIPYKKLLLLLEVNTALNRYASENYISREEKDLPNGRTDIHFYNSWLSLTAADTVNE
jgi:hypothetical protein